MIRFSLKCRNDHGFDSWFQSGAAFDTLRAAGHVTCPICGETEVEKALMAPALAPARRRSTPEAAEEAPVPVAQPSDTLEAKLRALRAHVEANSDYVGRDFVSQARQMHLGELPERPIHGEAKPAEARALLEEGIAVAPLPFIPSRRSN